MFDLGNNVLCEDRAEQINTREFVVKDVMATSGMRSGPGVFF